MVTVLDKELKRQITVDGAEYTVTLDPVPIVFNFPAVLRQTNPVQATYDTGVFTGSGDGTVEGNVIPVDINLTPPRASTSGCEAADFAGLDFSGPNDIALVQRGTCFFGTKAYYAEQAGAEAGEERKRHPWPHGAATSPGAERR